MGKVLAVILARGGSKGLPGKNILPLLGKPVLAYTVEAALQARTLDRVILSTDAEEIAAVGRKAGVEVPFIRPAELATVAEEKSHEAAFARSPIVAWAAGSRSETSVVPRNSP